MRHLREQYPNETLLYLADQAHVPYGARTVQEIRHYSEEITRFLLHLGAKIIVVACNTASAAALNHLRETFPTVPIVGLEPAVKPAALMTRSGKVGVLATPATFASPRYSSLMTRFAEDVSVLEDPCVGLVDLIEEGQLDTPATADLLGAVLRPMLHAGVDTLVLGCTHYPLVMPLIATISTAESDGAVVSIIDPAPAVARQVGRVLAQSGLHDSPEKVGLVHLFTTADVGTLGRLADYSLGEQFSVTEVQWRNSTLDTAGLDSL